MTRPPMDPKQRNQALARLMLVGVVVLLALRMFMTPGSAMPSEALSTLTHDLTAGKVEKVVVYDSTQTLLVTYKDHKKFQSSYPLGYGAKLVENYSADAKIEVVVAPPASLLSRLLPSLLSVVLLMGFMVWFLRKQGMGKKIPGLSTLRSTDSVPKVRFGDVGGVDEVVAELAEIVDYLHNPDRYTAMGAKVPHGVLLVGPPGTGKTMLAKAVAGEAGVPFFALSGSDFVETFVGVGASRMREVFSQARKAGKAIIFIDELDAVGRSRSAGPSNGANEESDRTLNALLVEMDGFVDSNVIVLGATNRPEVLDSALLRSGRFDRKITVGAPDRRGREQILKLLVANKQLGPDVDLASLAGRTSSMTGADLAFLINEAAMQAAREQASVITMAHLVAALEVVAIGRARSSMVVSEHERTLTAWHEAGHAVASLVLEAADDPVLVSIVPRGAAGGVTWMEGDDQNFISRSRAKAQLLVLLAGRAGEMRLVGDDITSGVSSDLREAGKLATMMVTQWAMSDLGAHWSQIASTGEVKDAEAAEIDRILGEALVGAEELLEEHAALHEAVAAAVLEDDVIDGARLKAIWAEVEAGKATA